MTITLIQSGGSDADSATSITLAYSSNVTSGNRIVIGVSTYTGASNDPPLVGDISQSAGTATVGTFTRDRVDTRQNASSNYVHSAIFSALVTTTGSCTITIAGAPAGSYLNIGLMEFNSDAGTISVSSSTNGSNGNSNAPDTGNVTSSASIGAVFVGALGVITGNNITITPDAAFNQVYEQQDGTAHNVASFIDRIVSTATTDSASWALSLSLHWTASLVLYEEPIPSTTPISLRSGSGSISPVAYEIWLTTDGGVRIAQLDYTLGLTATKVDQGMGWFSLSLPSSFNLSLINPDNIVQIWRAPRGGRLKLWQVYFLRKWTFATSGSQETILLEGPDIKDLLRRRIVAAYTASAQATKTNFADDMMKEVVTESIADGVAPIPTAGSRIWDNLSIAADTGSGPTITRSFPFDKLLTSSNSGVIPTLAKAAREAGTEVFFDIVPNVISFNSITFQFQTAVGQPGQDVSDRVVFSQDRGNLQDPSLTFDYSEEENYIYAGGKGEESSRDIQQVYDSVRYDSSIWNRCEGFADARNQSASNGVREIGRAQLEEGRPKISFSANLLDTEGTRFGRDWDYGYKVKARYKNIEFSSIVRAVTISVDTSGEKIQARAEYNE